MIARYLALGLALGLLSFSAHAQRSLETAVAEASAEWMFGQWQGQAENGETLTLNVSWDLDKRVVVLHVKTGETESKGYTVLEPGADSPKFYSFDNKGSVGKGSWSMENGEMVLRVDIEGPGRGPFKVGLVFAGSSSAGLQIRVHRLDSSGALETPAGSTFKMKKAG